jgi:hypothetical protein
VVEQSDLLRSVVSTLERLGVPYMIVGSYGSIVYGEPRFTNDIDIVADLPTCLVSDLCSAFPSPEFYLSEAAARDAVANRFQFNLLHPATGNKVDLIIPRNDEWGRTQLDRRRRVNLGEGFEVYAAAPEDVIIGKLWYYAEGGSDKHLRDIASILKVSGDVVDRGEVAHWAEKLGYTDIWQSVLARVDPKRDTGGAVDGAS